MKLYLFYSFFISYVICPTPVTWNQDPAIQTGNLLLYLGQYDLVIANSPQGTLSSLLPYQPAYAYSVTYSNAVTNFPTSAMGKHSIKTGITSLEFKNDVNTLIFFNNYVSGVGQTSLNAIHRYNGTNSIVKLRVSVMVCD